MDYLGWVLLALVTYGLLAPLTSRVTKEIPPTVALFSSTVVFLSLSLVVMVITGDADPAYATTPAAGYVYVAGFFLAAGILAYYVALERGPVSVVVPIYGMFIVGSSVIGILFLAESLTATRAAGIACAVVAIYLAATAENGTPSDGADGGEDLVPDGGTTLDCNAPVNVDTTPDVEAPVEDGTTPDVEAPVDVGTTRDCEAPVDDGTRFHRHGATTFDRDGPPGDTACGRGVGSGRSDASCTRGGRS